MPANCLLVAHMGSSCLGTPTTVVVFLVVFQSTFKKEDTPTLNNGVCKMPAANACLLASNSRPYLEDRAAAGHRSAWRPTHCLHLSVSGCQWPKLLDLQLAFLGPQNQECSTITLAGWVGESSPLSGLSDLFGKVKGGNHKNPLSLKRQNGGSNTAPTLGLLREVERLIFCSGKIYYELAAERERQLVELDFSRQPAMFLSVLEWWFHWLPATQPWWWIFSGLVVFITCLSMLDR